jgi:hypothetical protein
MVPASTTRVPQNTAEVINRQIQRHTEETLARGTVTN